MKPPNLWANIFCIVQIFSKSKGSHPHERPPSLREKSKKFVYVNKLVEISTSDSHHPPSSWLPDATPELRLLPVP